MSDAYKPFHTSSRLAEISRALNKKSASGDLVASSNATLGSRHASKPAGHASYSQADINGAAGIHGVDAAAQLLTSSAFEKLWRDACVNVYGPTLEQDLGTAAVWERSAQAQYNTREVTGASRDANWHDEVESALSRNGCDAEDAAALSSVLGKSWDDDVKRLFVARDDNVSEQTKREGATTHTRKKRTR